LKSGAAYVPIEVEYPQHRKSYMFQDSKIRVLITESDKLFTISDYEGELFAIDVQMEHLDVTMENPALSNTSNDLAYVIYTSGSTGKPKGVMVEHGGSVNMILSQLSILGIEKSDKILQFASASFDASVYEIFMALYSGATLVMADSERMKDPSKFSELLRSEEVTVATLPPSFVNVLPKNTFNSLRVLITAGEAANVSDAIGLSQHLKYVNAYGPTECSVCVTTHNVTRSDGKYGSIPIGDSIYNTGVYLFNSALQLVPVGVDGELYVSGAGLARGYINQLELTKEKFIEHPYKKGERLYKTGDLCRWTEEGELLYKGRIDRQLKVRGHRIEAQEIETVLEEIEEVDEALVESIKSSAEDTVLVAYLVGADIKVDGMKKRLSKILPSFMVPDYFVTLKAFPLTTQGKVDRKQLPRPQELASNNEDFVAPQSKIEKELAKIWGKVLGKHAIGVEDNFFDIGGQSLKAIQIVFEIQKILNIRIELKTLFTNPTIKSLTGVLSKTESDIYKPIPAISYQENYPVSYAQKRLWVLNKFDKENAVFNIPIACKIQGVLDVNAFNSAFRLLIQRHEILRTGIVELNGEPRQKILRPEDVIFNFDAEIIAGDDKDSKIKAVAKEEADFVFSLEKAPLFRARLLKISDNEFVFLFTMHHIISDGWSNNILIAELFNFYKASKDNESILLPPLTIQYKDY
jgi:amino acid adenylation domain-containing protein